ncbi:hypothetical protein [Streptomyces abyssomicinicus]|uniref:hypothetical protein n=1 Tax=Streptomyces abyssomicinicus TaxID=574929 RepID=UPI00124FD3B3|nr:hypothetical protein [Streptomyces abyssomicinicus]
MFLRTRAGRNTASVLTTLLLLGGMGAATAGTSHAGSQAVYCNVYGGVNGGGQGVMKGTYNLKNGPSASCPNQRSVSTNTTFYFWCGGYNDAGNLWLYGRVAGGSSASDYGWMSADNFKSWPTGWSYC